MCFFLSISCWLPSTPFTCRPQSRVEHRTRSSPLRLFDCPPPLEWKLKNFASFLQQIPTGYPSVPSPPLLVALFPHFHSLLFFFPGRPVTFSHFPVVPSCPRTRQELQASTTTLPQYSNPPLWVGFTFTSPGVLNTHRQTRLLLPTQCYPPQSIQWFVFLCSLSPFPPTSRNSPQKFPEAWCPFPSELESGDFENTHTLLLSPSSSARNAGSIPPLTPPATQQG